MRRKRRQKATKLFEMDKMHSRKTSPFPPRGRIWWFLFGFPVKHFFHTKTHSLDFSFNMSSFLFYLQGCCSSMYTCVCVLLTVDVASAGTGAPGDDICGRVHGHSGRNSRHQLWAVQTQAAFSRLRVEDFNFSLHASDGDAVVADPFRAEREHPSTGLRVVSNGYFRFRGRDGRVPHADAVVVARG